MQNSKQLQELLSSLASTRPIFHSEDDFKHALAWKIHEQGYEVRLEKPFEYERERIHVDIWATREKTSVAIELKYKPKKLRVEIASEIFALKNQSAQPEGRYDFLKDIERLQGIVPNGGASVGYAIFLTNDKPYWRNSGREGSLDSEFRIYDGREIQQGEKLRWQELRDWMGKRKSPISIENTYHLCWKPYSIEEKIKEKIGCEFQYLLVKVPP